MSIHRDRPLQNSMLLLEQNSKQTSFDFSMQPRMMKKSFVANDGPQHIQSFFSPQHHAHLGNSPRPLRHTTEQFRENYAQKNQDQALKEVAQKLQKLTRQVDKHELQLSSKLPDPLQNEQAMAAIVGKIRQNMPVLPGNTDLNEHLFNIKLDIKTLQDEVSQCVKEITLKKSERNMKEFVMEQVRKIENEMESKSNESLYRDIFKKRDEMFQGSLRGLENEIEFLRKHLQKQSLEMKVSPICSSSSIMLKYQELFKAKSKNEPDMIINERIYYIDNQGYLLDNQSRYITDQKGNNVRLENKHILMLRSQKILQ